MKTEKRTAGKAVLFETGNGNFHYCTMGVFWASGTGSGVF